MLLLTRYLKESHGRGDILTGGFVLGQSRLPQATVLGTVLNASFRLLRDRLNDGYKLPRS